MNSNTIDDLELKQKSPCEKPQLTTTPTTQEQIIS